MTRVMGPVLLVWLLAAGCGGETPAPDAPACSCYAWEGPNEGWSRGVDDFGAWARYLTICRGSPFADPDEADGSDEGG